MSHPLAPLADLPGVPDAVGRAREACETLRWHRALRRGWAAARVESGVQAAWAGLAFDGVRLPPADVRAAALGGGVPAGPAGEAVAGAVRVQAALRAGWPKPGGRAAPVPLGQHLAGLHLAVVGDGSAGRLRAAEAPGDLRGLGAAQVGPELAERLAALAAVLTAPGEVPALVVAAVAYGELLALRPFDHGNAAVARALLRGELVTRGVDPVGVVVPEAAWVANPAAHLAAAAGFATGEPDRVAAWLAHVADAVTAGAEVGTAVAEAVAAGRLAT